MVETYKLDAKRKRFFNLNTSLILVIINFACFILFSSLIYLKVIPLDYIAVKPSNVLNRFYLWTIVTSMFMHGGFFHLFANMLSMIFVGSLVERILGRKRFLVFYLIAGIFAGLFFILASLFLKSDFETYAVGASGALFGLIGFLMILTPNLPVYMMFIPIPIKMKYAAPAMLILLWLISLFGNVPIGNTAHLGGLIVGIVYAVYLRKKYKRKTQYISKFFS